MPSLIELQNLTKKYASFTALDSINLSIAPGVTGLLGPNGAGKSTLIKVLLGLVSTTSGSGTILGLPLGESTQELRSQIGYMPEDDCYINGLTGIESMQLAARLCGMDRTEALRRGHEILDFCGTRQERYRPVDTYSTGMRQKLRFALALVHDPKLLILDEPTTGLDPEERDAMLNRIRILSRDFSISVLLCTHILPDVQAVCEHVLILGAGTVRVSGSMQDLCRVQTPRFHLRVSGAASEFSERLQSRGMVVLETTADSISVLGQPEEHSTWIWQTAAELGQIVRSVTPAANSLEKLFLEAVQETEHGHS
jgi:ABC-2 type transport system ATP-binding protein